VKAIKVLHVEAGRHLYGGALQVLYLLRGLQQHGVRNCLVCPRGSAIGEQARGLVDSVHPVAFAGDLDMLFIARLWLIIRREQPDLVHLHSRRGADTLGGIAAGLSGTPTVLTRRVDNPESSLTVRLKYRLYDRVITISEAIRQVLIEEGLPPASVRCIHSAVDTRQYQSGCRVADFRQQLRIPEQHKVCGVIAQFIERKGHRYLLQAIPDILQRFADTTFVLFGKGPLEQELRAHCHQLGIEAAVRFAGFRDDLKDLMGCLDMVIHPAEMEGLGVSLLQAAASGVPVIGSRAGGIPEIVHHRVNGLLVPVADSQALGQAVLNLLQNGELARDMGARGREIVERDFSIERMVNDNLDVYRQLVSR
jgi:glycosyltransferase involved in cell wall biosynthesis